MLDSNPQCAILKLDSLPQADFLSGENMVKAKAAKTTKAKAKSQPKKDKPRVNGGLFGYFKNSWRELRLVRWPNRRATWSFTFAVLLFSAFFMLVILGLDAGFEFLFKRFVL